MKIANTGPVSNTPVRRTDRSSRASGAFASELNSKEAPREAAAPADVSAVGSLLSLQEVGDPLEGRRKAVRRGEDLLDRLDELRHGLLMGTFPAEKLDRLVALVRRQQDEVSDPRLLEILADIELRAAVELAKLGKFD